MNISGEPSPSSRMAAYAAFASPALAQQKVGSTTISVVPSTSAVVLFVARDDGYFEAKAWTSRSPNSPAAPKPGARWFGAVDMGGGSMGATLLMANQGSRPRTSYCPEKADLHAGRVQRDHGKLQRPQGAQGKTIGISSPGSLTDLFLRIPLRDAGMDPDRDVTLVAAGGLNAHLPALQAGRVDAQMTWKSPTVNITREEKAGAVFLELRGDNVPVAANMWAIRCSPRTSGFRTREFKAKATARAIAKASRTINADPDLILPSLQRIFHVVAGPA